MSKNLFILNPVIQVCLVLAPEDLTDTFFYHHLTWSWLLGHCMCLCSSAPPSTINMCRHFPQDVSSMQEMTVYVPH